MDSAEGVMGVEAVRVKGRDETVIVDRSPEFTESVVGFGPGRYVVDPVGVAHQELGKGADRRLRVVARQGELPVKITIVVRMRPGAALIGQRFLLASLGFATESRRDIGLEAIRPCGLGKQFGDAVEIGPSPILELSG